MTTDARPFIIEELIAHDDTMDLSELTRSLKARSLTDQDVETAITVLQRMGFVDLTGLAGCEVCRLVHDPKARERAKLKTLLVTMTTGVGMVTEQHLLDIVEDLGSVRDDAKGHDLDVEYRQALTKVRDEIIGRVEGDWHRGTGRSLP